MIDLSLYGLDSFCGDEVLWVQQRGYDGAWLTSTHPLFLKLKPVLDLLPSDTDDLSYVWEPVKTVSLSLAEWDAITDSALVP